MLHINQEKDQGVRRYVTVPEQWNFSPLPPLKALKTSLTGKCSMETATPVYGIIPFHNTDLRFKKKKHPQPVHGTFSSLQLE